MISEELLYTKSHEWIKVVGENEIKLGITNFAQEELGDIVGVELPEIDAEFGPEDPIGVVESVKSVSDINSPVNGKIIKVNETLEETPELINESPYDEGWFAEIQLDDPSELESLMNREEYDAFLEEEK